jgi:3-hydroxybutyryl-CoA dehydrogenase
MNKMTQTTTYEVAGGSDSRSFPPDDPFRQSAVHGGQVLFCLGGTFVCDSERAAVAVELGTESLAEYTGEEDPVHTNVVGFARFRNGDDPPSPLVELVRQALTSQTSVDAVRAILEAAGLTVVECSDQPGRIIDRLVRPKYNAALKFLDEGLATSQDMDLTCKLGLGYKDGPIERLQRGGLAHHYEVTQALFETFGNPAYAPPRRAIVAHKRRQRGTDY